MIGSEKVLHLGHQYEAVFPATDPFDFRHTLWKPSHFYTGLETHTRDTSWRTFRVGERVCGVRFSAGDRRVFATVFSDEPLADADKAALATRIDYSYGFSENITEFIQRCENLQVMQEPLRKLRGMRQSCPESLFEISIISLLLQNATIQRTRQMMENLLHHHGKVVHFDSISLRAFFSPREIASAEEDFHREQNRLGYRAKYVARFAEFFISRSHLLAPDAATLTEFEKIKGVGPYTIAILASHATRDPAALGLDVWNRKILARYLMGVDDAAPEEVMKACTQAFPGYEGLGALYLVEFDHLSRPAVELEEGIAGFT